MRVSLPTVHAVALAIVFGFHSHAVAGSPDWTEAPPDGCAGANRPVSSVPGCDVQKKEGCWRADYPPTLDDPGTPDLRKDGYKSGTVRNCSPATSTEDGIWKLSWDDKATYELSAGIEGSVAGLISTKLDGKVGRVKTRGEELSGRIRIEAPPCTIIEWSAWFDTSKDRVASMKHEWFQAWRLDDTGDGGQPCNWTAGDDRVHNGVPNNGLFLVEAGQGTSKVTAEVFVSTYAETLPGGPCPNASCDCEQEHCEDEPCSCDCDQDGEPDPEQPTRDENGHCDCPCEVTPVEPQPVDPCRCDCDNDGNPDEEQPERDADGNCPCPCSPSPPPQPTPCDCDDDGVPDEEDRRNPDGSCDCEVVEVMEPRLEPEPDPRFHGGGR